MESKGKKEGGQIMIVLRKGDRGEEVRTLQQALKDKGYELADDGIFGPATEKAVRDWQKSKGLVDDGIVGEKTWKSLGVAGGASMEVAITDGHIKTHITACLNRVVKYIAIHYTAGSTSRRGTAMATRNVFLSRKASADFVVDDDTIVLINPNIRNYYCWAVGDAKNGYSLGGRLYGKATNKNTISIEICSSLKPGTSAAVPNHEGWYFTEAALENALKLVRYLMRKYNIPKENVVRHYDISGKVCPGVIGWNNALTYTTDGKVTAVRSNSEKWKEFWNKI